VTTEVAVLVTMGVSSHNLTFEVKIFEFAKYFSAL
jgi:hypothetical protein